MSVDNNEKGLNNLYRPDGLHWITATLFIVADMAGGGVVLLPNAMLKSGSL